jgi:hypothetical protein
LELEAVVVLCPWAEQALLSALLAPGGRVLGGVVGLMVVFAELAGRVGLEPRELIVPLRRLITRVELEGGEPLYLGVLPALLCHRDEALKDREAVAQEREVLSLSARGFDVRDQAIDLIERDARLWVLPLLVEG